MIVVQIELVRVEYFYDSRLAFYELASPFIFFLLVIVFKFIGFLLETFIINSADLPIERKRRKNQRVVACLDLL